MVKRIPQLPPKQVYPEVPGKTNLNCCGDPDCGNYGVSPDFSLPKFLGCGAAQRRLLAAASIPALSTGRGVYTQGTPDDDCDRVSSILDYFQNPHGWSDGWILICEHQKGNGSYGVQFQLLSNQHLEDEVARLRSQNGVLTGPTCGACGRAYLHAPGEFAFNGLGGPKAKNPDIRLIHTPCRGQPGARFTVSAEHARQEDRSDNIRILSELVNEVGIKAHRRVWTPLRVRAR